MPLCILRHAADVDDNNVPQDDNARISWTFNQRAMLELTHNWGTNPLSYHDGIKILKVLVYRFLSSRRI